MSYVSINGEKYEKRLLDLATTYTTGRGEGELSKKEVLSLIACAKDGTSVTEPELKTLYFIRQNFNFSRAAIELFDAQMLTL